MEHPDDNPDRRFKQRAKDIIVDTIIVDRDSDPTGIRLVQVNGKNLDGEDVWILLHVRPDVRVRPSLS